jgi:hypothetical protein
MSGIPAAIPEDRAHVDRIAGKPRNILEVGSLDNCRAAADRRGSFWDVVSMPDPLQFEQFFSLMPPSFCA